MCESTVITIAHRLEAVKDADYVIVLAEGRVVDQGRAEEVLGRVNERTRDKEGEGSDGLMDG